MSEMIKYFIDDLTALCEKHGLILDGGIEFDLLPVIERQIVSAPGEIKKVRPVRKFNHPAKFKIKGIITTQWMEEA